MLYLSLAVFVAVSSSLLGVSAGPLAKRQDSTSASSSSQPSEAAVVSTMSNSKPTTFNVVAPTSSASSDAAASTAAATSASQSEVASKTSAASTVVSSLPASHDFPTCLGDTTAAPFCLPNNESSLYVGTTYYVTWNADYFPINSTVTVKLNYANSSSEQAWSSPETANNVGVTTITMSKDWLQGYSMYNLTFYALMYDPTNVEEKSIAYDGPTITLTNAPSNHYQPPAHTKAPNKMGLYIGLPVSLGFVALVVCGLFIGMRKQRKIGLGNIMGRRHGYGGGKSKRQRMGLGKKGAIRLQDREIMSNNQYRDQPTSGHTRGDSLGSLVSNDGIRPAPGQNAFREEISRQKTGR